LDQNLFPEALADFVTALELKPHYAKAYNGKYPQLTPSATLLTTSPPLKGLGLVHCDMGQPHRAISDFSKAIEMAPGYHKSLLYRGNVYSDLGQLPLAVIDYSVRTHCKIH